MLHNLRAMGSNPVVLNLGCVLLLSKSYLNQRYISMIIIALTKGIYIAEHAIYNEKNEMK